MARRPGTSEGNAPGTRPGNKPPSLLDKYTGGASGGAHDAGNSDGNSDGNGPGNEAVITGNLVITGGPHAQMLDLRFRDGKRRAFPYSYLSELRIDPSGDLICVFPAASVAIAGRNLAPIYTAITNHTALAVVESPSGFDDGGEQPYVQSISVEAESAR